MNNGRFKVVVPMLSIFLRLIRMLLVSRATPLGLKGALILVAMVFVEV